MRGIRSPMHPNDRIQAQLVSAGLVAREQMGSMLECASQMTLMRPIIHIPDARSSHA